MSQYPNEPARAADRAQVQPVVALREQLSQTMTAANQLGSILAKLDDPGGRSCEPR